MRDVVRQYANEWITEPAVTDEDARAHGENVAVLYQSLYLFRAFTMQVAGHLLGASQWDRFNASLDPLLASAAIKSCYRGPFDGSTPQEAIDVVVREYYDGGENTEAQFREYTRGEHAGGEILFKLHFQFSKNISLLLAGDEISHAAPISLATAPAAQAFWADSKVPEAIAELARVDLPDFNSAGLLQYLMRRG